MLGLKNIFLIIFLFNLLCVNFSFKFSERKDYSYFIKIGIEFDQVLKQIIVRKTQLINSESIMDESSFVIANYNKDSLFVEIQFKNDICKEKYFFEKGKCNRMVVKSKLESNFESEFYWLLFFDKWLTDLNGRYIHKGQNLEVVLKKPSENSLFYTGEIFELDTEKYKNVILKKVKK